MERYRSATEIASVVELTAPFRSADLFEQKDLFIAGLDDTNSLRIPALLTTSNATVLAFCEEWERDDCDPLDLVVKRSVKTEKNLQGVSGVTWPNDRKWLSMQVVVPGGGEAAVNPCVVLDRLEGTVWLCCRKAIGGLAVNLGGVRGPLILLSSTDDGATWTVPIDITDNVGDFLPGPGVGVQLRNGRLIILGYDKQGSKVIYSDDHGRTWRAGESVGGPLTSHRRSSWSTGTWR